MSQKDFSVDWDSKDRMHMVIGLLAKDTYRVEDHKNAHTVLYAYTDRRQNGVQVEWGADSIAILTEAGPNQGEVILSEADGGGQIAVDKADRPMIWCHSDTTGSHCFRLESWRWVDYPASPGGGEVSTDPSGVAIAKHYKKKEDGFSRFWPPHGRNSKTLDASSTWMKMAM